MAVSAIEAEQHFLRLLVEVGVEDAVVDDDRLLVLAVEAQQAHLHVPHHQRAALVRSHQVLGVGVELDESDGGIVLLLVAHGVVVHVHALLVAQQDGAVGEAHGRQRARDRGLHDVHLGRLLQDLHLFRYTLVFDHVL